MAKFKIHISILLIFSLMFSSLIIPVTASEALFSDVKEKDWFAPAVQFAYDQKLLEGVGKNRFAPATPVNRAMVATVLYRMDKSTLIYNESYFEDVSIDSWYFNAVAYCYERGILKGVGDRKFDPMAPITRQDLVTMFYRYANLEQSGSEELEYLLPAFKDIKKISNYAVDPVNWALNNGIVEGVDIDRFDPKGKAERSQFAQILMNYAEATGTDVTNYRLTDKNYFGVRISGCRILNKKLTFRLSGSVNPYVLDLFVRFKLNGKLYEEQHEIIPEFELNGSYTFDASKLYASDPINTGLSMDGVIEILVKDSDSTVCSKKIYCGAIKQQATDIPVYFKGEKKLDCRILLYHEFTEKVPAESRYSVVSTPRRFEENMLYLLNAGYTIIPLEALLDYESGRRALPEKSVVITFDDGYLSNYTLIYPILKKYHIPATIFVTVCNMNIDPNKMTWEQMREMEESGLVSIQSHSWKHVYHDTLPEDELRNYVDKSFETLEANLGKRKRRLFAYPHGKYSERSVQVLKEYDVKMQMTTEGKPLDMDHLDLSRVSRLTVSYDSDIAGFMKRK